MTELLTVVHRVYIPGKLLVDIRAAGCLTEHQCAYLRRVADILESQTIEDAERLALLAALSAHEPEPVALSKGIR